MLLNKYAGDKGGGGGASEVVEKVDMLWWRVRKYVATEYTY